MSEKLQNLLDALDKHYVLQRERIAAYAEEQAADPATVFPHAFTLETYADVDAAWSVFTPEQQKLISAIARAGHSYCSVYACLKYEQPASRFALDVNSAAILAGFELARKEDVPLHLLEDV